MPAMRSNNRAMKRKGSQAIPGNLTVLPCLLSPFHWVLGIYIRLLLPAISALRLLHCQAEANSQEGLIFSNPLAFLRTLDIQDWCVHLATVWSALKKTLLTLSVLLCKTSIAFLIKSSTASTSQVQG